MDLDAIVVEDTETDTLNNNVLRYSETTDLIIPYEEVTPYCCDHSHQLEHVTVSLEGREFNDFSKEVTTVHFANSIPNRNMDFSMGHGSSYYADHYYPDAVFYVTRADVHREDEADSPPIIFFNKPAPCHFDQSWYAEPDYETQLQRAIERMEMTNRRVPRNVTLVTSGKGKSAKEDGKARKNRNGKPLK